MSEAAAADAAELYTHHTHTHHNSAIIKAPGATLPLRQPKMAFTDSLTPYSQPDSHPYRLQFSFMKFLIRIYTCDIPLNFFHKILRVLSSVRHFFSVARDTPLNFFHKILRVLSSVRHFFSVARDTPLTFFHKILRVLSSVRHFFSVARDRIIAL
jgi:hypothetical protein